MTNMRLRGRDSSQGAETAHAMFVEGKTDEAAVIVASRVRHSTLVATPETGGGIMTEFGFPSFCSADLRFIGDILSDPLTRAIRNDTLSFHAPVWSEDARRSLAGLGDARSDAVAVAIRRGTLRFAVAPFWPSGLQAIESVFALKRRPHLFRAEPSVTWTTFTEPQLTKGFARFLNDSEPVARSERVRALLKALGAAELCKGMTEVVVTAEAPTSGNRRIDLLIEWQDTSEQPYAAAIEAKLGHHVTSGQLPAYRNHLRNIAKDGRLLVVVAPRLTSRTGRSLQRNRDWRWTAWRDLLIAYERALPVDYDDAEYLRFRRTLWDQTG